MSHKEEAASQIVRAAGGLVTNANQDVLVIFRRNKWDLPKGKIDPGEREEDCALREVSEETGLKHLELGDFLLVTHHHYEENGLSLIKETHWYRIASVKDEPLVPQTEEDITEIKWVGREGLDEIRQNTYPNILEVLKAGGYA